MAWTKTISAPACNAARIGCVAATSPIRSKPPSPATCKSWVNRSATRLAPWAVLSTLPRTPRSTAPWTIYPVCATNSPASADVPTLNLDRVSPVNLVSSKRKMASRASNRAGQGGGRQSGPVGNRLAGPVGNPAGGGTNRDRNVIGAYDTGNTRISGQAVAPQQGPNPADTQRQIDQGLNLLNQVRAAVQDSPEARQQLQSLIDQMRNLDPSRFPGNPALVEQMHQQLVSGVDALELQLRRQLDEIQGGTIRNTDPTKVPAGYRGLGRRVLPQTLRRPLEDLVVGRFGSPATNSDAGGGGAEGPRCWRCPRSVHLRECPAGPADGLIFHE